MATKNANYPGNLGKRLTISEWNAAVSAVLLNVQLDGLPAKIAAIREWQQDRVAKLLVNLLHYFEIPLDADDKWFSLALRLAFKHVPAFQDAKLRGVGRPKKLKPFRSLAELANQYAQTTTKGKPGRPKKWTDELRRKILDDVQSTCEKEGLRGRGSIKKALEILLKRAPRRQYWVRRLQKLHSEAKRPFWK